MLHCTLCSFFRQTICWLIDQILIRSIPLHSALFYYRISIKNLMAFVPFMLHLFSGIIYPILCALHPLACHWRNFKLIYLTKPFLLRLSSLSEILSGFCLCFVLWLSSLDKLASNLSLLGELATCKEKTFYYYYYVEFQFCVWKKYEKRGKLCESLFLTFVLLLLYVSFISIKTV